MMDQLPHVFPTQCRDKLSHILSYPIGAEALSRALDGVPQHPMISCHFKAGSATTPHEHEKPRFIILSILYEKIDRCFHHGPDAAVRGVFDPRWTISIYAVPRQFRHAIKTALLTESLPDIAKPWLIEQSAITGKTGGSVLWLMYDRADSRLVPSFGGAILPDRA
jgi:hypothetical protein